MTEVIKLITNMNLVYENVSLNLSDNQITESMFKLNRFLMKNKLKCKQNLIFEAIGQQRMWC